MSLTAQKQQLDGQIKEWKEVQRCSHCSAVTLLTKDRRINSFQHKPFQIHKGTLLKMITPIEGGGKHV